MIALRWRRASSSNTEFAQSYPEFTVFIVLRSMVTLYPLDSDDSTVKLSVSET